MYILDPLYNNRLGSAFIIKNSYDDTIFNSKIQLLIGDIAVIMDVDEIKRLLITIRSAQKGCQNKNCNCQQSSKNIKCNTQHAEIIFKLNEEKLVFFEELILGILFHTAYEDLLSFNQID
ncbi:hypothetical protein GCM10022393_32950 [Aquimarina addita]|uniref:Uncharacterized protein n=1 Tax=Aquimarina addita TaxID=870485 RepID=A0ABP6UP67_9FLAO